MQPLVSVIIPSFNSSSWIRECIHSVLRQSYSNREIIVVDDGSRDGTPEIVREFADRIRFLQLAHVGVGSARNAAIKASEGEFVAFLDSDDLWEEDKLRKHIDFMKGSPEYCMSYTDAEEFEGSGSRGGFFSKFPSLASDTDIAESMVLCCAIPLTSTVLIRRDFLRRHGIGFHPVASCAEDMSLFLEIYLLGGKIGRLDECLTRRRLHSSNTSGDHYNRFVQRLIVYRDLLQKYPAAPHKTRHLLRAGLRDASFRVGEWHWGQMELGTAREHFRRGIGLDAIGVRSCCFWALTLAPKRALLLLKQLRTRAQGVVRP
jgi:teichuronic acid biosynthesis glycosyltransferase TuaG